MPSTGLAKADPGFAARTYADVMRDGSKRRRASISPRDHRGP
jgi:hypothetical protein